MNRRERRKYAKSLGIPWKEMPKDTKSIADEKRAELYEELRIDSADMFESIKNECETEREYNNALRRILRLRVGKLK